MINSRNVNDLNWYVKENCLLLIKNLKQKGVDIIVTSTLRDQEYQTQLWNQGRTTPGIIVTNAKLIGPHAFGLAFDVAPVVNGKVVWHNPKLWDVIGTEGEKLGFEWGGKWKGFIDRPHFQMVEGLTSEQLRAGKRPSFYNKPKLKTEYKDVVKWLNSNIEMDVKYWLNLPETVPSNYVETILTRIYNKFGGAK